MSSRYDGLLAEEKPRPQLLIVDDQPLNIRLFHEIFHVDHEVFFATSGEDALGFAGPTLPT